MFFNQIRNAGVDLGVGALPEVVLLDGDFEQERPVLLAAFKHPHVPVEPERPVVIAQIAFEFGPNQLQSPKRLAWEQW